MKAIPLERISVTREDPLFGLCASAPVQYAQETLDHLRALEALDRHRATTRREGRLLVPVTDAQAARQAPHADLVEAPLAPSDRRGPLPRVRERLRGRIPDRLQGPLPGGWQRVGDVILLRLPDPLLSHPRTIGEAYGRTLDAKAVLHMEGAQGPWREPITQHLWGDEDTETEHTEHGITYRLDPAQVLFSPGNHHERHRLTDTVTDDEHVVDLCAGIGYFTLPLAREGARVTACEINPTSVAYLEDNVRLNEVTEQVTVLPGDANETAPTGTADRVLLGYFPGTLDFLDTARQALRPEGGTLHVHLERAAKAPLRAAWEEIQEHPSLREDSTSLLQARTVKTTGPGHVHIALDVEVEP